MSMKNPLTPAGIEPATFRFVAQHINLCATAVPHIKLVLLHFFKHSRHIVGRDSSVGTATDYGLDGPGIESQLAGRFSASVQTGSGAHQASYTMSKVKHFYSTAVNSG